MTVMRPERLAEIIGQSDAVQMLNIVCESARKRSQPINHTLFEGPPGLGKTTLARAVANEMGSKIHIANGANVGNLKKMLPYVMKLGKGDILFVDEIHSLPAKVQEFLFPVMEDYRVDMSDGKNTESIDIPQFTLIGATTEGGSLLAPLRDRFKNKVKLDLYCNDSMMKMATINSIKMGVDIDDDGLAHLAKMCRGTPRILNSRLEWIRDYVVAHSIVEASKSDVIKALSIVGVDERGLTEQDRKYLITLAETIKTTGKPVGLNTMVASTNLSQDDITQVVEPYLLRNGMIYRTPKGRVLGKWKSS